MIHAEPRVVLLITRPAESARKLVKALKDRGVEALAWPAFDLLPPEDPDAVVRAVHALNQIDAVVFVSPAAVHAFAAQLRKEGKHSDHEARRLPVHVSHWPSNCIVGAVGRGTRDAVIASLPGIEPDNIVCPSGEADELAGSEGLIRAWPRQGGLPRAVLLVRAQRGREKIGEWFARQGAIVHDLVAYVRQEHVPDEQQWNALRGAVQAGAHIAVLYTSSEAVAVVSRQFMEIPGDDRNLRIDLALCSHSRIAHTLEMSGGPSHQVCEIDPEAIANAVRRYGETLYPEPAPIPSLDIEI